MANRKRKASQIEPEALPEQDIEVNDEEAELETVDKAEGSVGAANPEKKKKKRRKKNKDASGEPGSRFIVFVGNLPYSATSESIRTHFEAYHPTAVRCLTKATEPTKCRGCAFVEFEKGEHMRTCLDKLHHSMFDDGKSKPRAINVELTAGGGGRSESRLEKIKLKNKKLQDNRGKRIELEKKAKEEKAQGKDNKEDGGQDQVHPSRKKRIPQTS